jgi:OOP family OmpA-OmpF porin
MKTICIGIILSLGCAAASAQDSGWYLGGGAGRLDAKNACNGNTNAGCDGSVGIGKGFGGYQFNRNFAVEGAFLIASSFEVFSASTSVGILEASAVGILPLNERFSLFGKGGLYHAQVEIDAGLFFAAEHRTSSGLMAGFGGSVDFTPKLTGRIEWQRYFDIDFVARRTDTDVISVGLAYRWR